MTISELPQVTTLVHSLWPQWIEKRGCREGGEIVFNKERTDALWSWFNRYRVDDVLREIRGYYRMNPDGFPKLHRIVEGVKTSCGLGMDDKPRWSWRDENTLRDVRRRLRIDLDHGRNYYELCDDDKRHAFPITADCLTDEWILAKLATSFGCSDPTEPEREEARAMIERICSRK